MDFMHASAVVLGEQGVLIRGPSGSGKSSLARALIRQVSETGGYAALVGDDRIGVEARNGRLIARPHPAIAGQIELRGAGILEVPFQSAVCIVIVVECAAHVERLPAHTHISIHNVSVRRIYVGENTVESVESVLSVLKSL